MTARARLTILFTGLVLAAGVALIAITHVLVSDGLAKRFTVLLLGTGPGDVPSPRDLPSAEQLREQVLGDLLTRSAVALTVVTALAAVLGWLVAGKVLRPIRAMTATAHRLSAEHLDERIPVTAPADELAALATTLNGMLDRVQRGLDAHRLFVANAAHELRTPLATMRIAVDVTLDGEPTREELLAMATDVRTETERSRRTLDGLLVLARSQAAPPRRSSLDLAAVAAAALPETAAAKLEAAPVEGEPALITRLVENLVDNATRHNHQGGWVEVSTGVEAGRPVLRVSNTGPKIAEETIGRLVEPFARGTSGERVGADGGGVGLGLSIVRAIAEAHDAELTLTAREAGGLDVVVRFARG